MSVCLTLPHLRWVSATIHPENACQQAQRILTQAKARKHTVGCCYDLTNAMTATCMCWTQKPRMSHLLVCCIAFGNIDCYWNIFCSNSFMDALPDVRIDSSHSFLELQRIRWSLQQMYTRHHYKPSNSSSFPISLLFGKVFANSSTHYNLAQFCLTVTVDEKSNSDSKRN